MPPIATKCCGANHLLQLHPIALDAWQLARQLRAHRDAGPGLNPESFSHLFEPFYTTKPEGMGMGLSICRSIIEAHGGWLWATPCEPQGALFQFTIPAD